MTQKNLLSVLDISRELNTGRATTKFLLKRFKNRIPPTFIDGQPFYPNTVIQTLFTIQGKLEMGILPNDIEQQLDGNPPKTDNPKESDEASTLLNALSGNENQQGDIHLSKDGLNVLESAFLKIGEQQKRIAKAHEKRAQVEERKAVAIEKRAQAEERKAVAIEQRALAEEKKAAAMDNIAKALQEMNRLRAPDPAMQQIAHQTVDIIASDEKDPLSETAPTLNESLPDDDGLSDSPFKDQLRSEMDDLSLLIDQGTKVSSSDTDIPTDDLSALLDDEPVPDEPQFLEENGDENEILDDLSLLIDSPPEAMDNLSALDDLSALIDEELPETALKGKKPPVDDLSALIDSPADEPDDLSALIDTPDTANGAASDDQSVSEMDDLSLLIDSTPSDEAPPSIPDEPEAQILEDNDPIQIDLSPQDDLEKYKSAVMAVIIKLKTDGLSVEQTTDKLNLNKIETLSGKSEWSRKAISQIYKFIEAAK